MSVPDQNPQSPVAPVVIALLAAGALLLGLGFWSSRRSADEDRGARAIPTLEIVSPAEGDLVQGDVPLLFRTDDAIRFQRDGWTAAGVHLHVLVDGVERMPRREDIVRVEPGLFRWTLTADPGRREFQLIWSGSNHRPVPGAVSGVVGVEVR